MFFAKVIFVGELVISWWLALIAAIIVVLLAAGLVAIIWLLIHGE